MGFLKCLLLGAVFANAVAAQPSWVRPAQKAQEPASPQLHQRVNPLLVRPAKAPVTEAPFHNCQVEEDEKIQCGLQDVTAEQCETINCCFDGRQCYYGKTVTVQCTRDGQFVVVVARDTTLPNIDVESVTLLETNADSCSPVGITSAFAIFQFPVTACGTTMTEEDGYVVYENHMSSSYEVGIGPRGSITRDSHFELLFQCKYSGSAVEALVIDVNTVPPPLSVAASGPLRVELRLASGRCFTKGCVEEDAAYGSYYTASDYPVTKALREPLYVEVHILDRSDPNIVLTLEHCWATSAPSANSLPQWDLLVDGCPYQDDRYLTTVVSVDESSGLAYPSHYKRFIVKMFTFVDEESYTPRKGMVFLHCATAVCHPSSTSSCEQPCHRRRRAVSAVKVPSSQGMLVSSGGVLLSAELPISAKYRGKKTPSYLTR